MRIALTFTNTLYCGLLVSATGTIATVAPQGAHAATDEIVVTTRRREENLQDVPLSILAIPKQEIQDRGITSFEAVAVLDPSVLFDRGFSAEDVKIGIRGLSNTRGRSNVAFLIDGVDVTSEAVGTGGSSLLSNLRLLSDVEAIEVVKGPQSALYGRAAFAGAISYVTKAPGLEEVEGNYGLELADNNYYQLSAGINGPVVPGHIGMGIQAVVWDSDSFYDNGASGRNFGGSDGWGLSYTVNIEPNDNVSIKWRNTYSEDTSGAQPYIVLNRYTEDRMGVPTNVLIPGDDLIELPIPEMAKTENGGPIEPTAFARFRAPTLGKVNGRQSFASEDPITGEEYEGSSIELFRTTLNVAWDVGPGTFSYIGSATLADLDLTQDVDYQARGFPDQIRNNFEADSTNDTTQVSHEIRYATALEGPFNFSVGALGWRERRDVLLREYLVTCASGFGICEDGNWQDLIRSRPLKYGDAGFSDSLTTHFSVYGQSEWQLSDKLTLGAEARVSTENFEITRTLGALCVIAPFGAPPCSPAAPATESGSVRSSFVTPRVTIDYALNDDTLLYGYVAKGQKPAGISTVQTGGAQPINDLAFAPEKMWAYEAGWKTSFDNAWGNLTLNGALFFQDYSDKQVVLTVNDPLLGAVPAIENASAAEVFGQEIQVTWLPAFMDGLKLNVAYTHLDAEYTDYISTTELKEDIIEVGNCNLVSLPNPNNPSNPRAACEVDRSGHKLEKAPEHALFASIGVIRPFKDNWDYLVELDAQFQDERFASNNNFTIVEASTRWNLRVGVKSDEWSIIAFADNLFDDDTITSGGDESPDFGERFAIPPGLITTSQLPIPRQIGVRINRSFGG